MSWIIKESYSTSVQFNRDIFKLLMALGEMLSAKLSECNLIFPA